MARDWVEWHRAYADPASELSQRLEVVTASIVGVLDGAPRGPIRVLSLCTGEARDLSGAAIDHPRAGDLTGAAVELSGGLASIAASNLSAAGTAIEVRCADAGRSIHWADVLPVDLLVIAGIFGNLTDHHVQRTIAAVPAMVTSGGSVIWTRHRKDPDLTPQIREWFDAAGCVPTSFVSAGPGSFAVGVERCEHAGPVPEIPDLLFRFTDS
ncbi:MAG: hypothetical protein RLZZ623_60 [Actinomycetota bacterium]